MFNNSICSFNEECDVKELHFEYSVSIFFVIIRRNLRITYWSKANLEYD